MSASAMTMATLSFLGTYWAHSTLALALAALVTIRMSRRLDHVADAVWKTAMTVPVLSAGTAWLLSRRGIATAEPLVIPRPEDLLAAGNAHVALDLLTAACVGWAAIAAMLLARLGARHHAHRRALGRRHPVAPHIARRLGIGARGTPRLTTSHRCIVPVALGGEVCLPAPLLRSLNGDELRSIMAHELAHERRRDPLWRVLSHVVNAVFFFQPLNRVAATKLADLSEWICDAQAFTDRTGGRALASALVRVIESARRRTDRGLLVSALVQAESLALRRVRAALGAPMSRTPAMRVTATPALTAAAAVLVILASLPPLAIDSTGLVPFTINARDKAGPFTITIDRGTVVAASLRGEPLPPTAIVQRGNDVWIADPAGGPLRLTLRRGGISWDSRPHRPAPTGSP
jgi:Zn-dependent protease with chaperone function